ncbi:MAG: adenylate kinase [Clostridia bacterium]|nr:adenylate kinase [Clostridia bacterium]
MKKILVIGCPGSGKTTFAEKLRDKTELPLYYLDAIWHKPDRTHISRDEFDAILDDLLAQDAWIIDGNYGRTLERRLSACDTVFFFDLPTEVCLEGAIARLGRKRADMPWFDTDLDPALRQNIEAFRSTSRLAIYALLEAYKNKNVIIFASREQADAFFEEEST